MQGLGNDFIVVDEIGLLFSTSLTWTPALAQKVCDRRWGVGADQVLLLRMPQNLADVRMEIWNADGSGAEMCGNGIRAVALYLSQYSKIKKKEYLVETLAGVKTVQIRGNQVRVDMGQPVFGSSFQDQGETFFEVSMGNPHAVAFVQSVAEFPVESRGPSIECHSRFPKRTNVEFVEVIDLHSIQVRVWERGAGITLACGTGACAAAVISLANNHVKGPVDVHLPGGVLKISWDGPGHSVRMEGPAQEVFQGKLILEESFFS